MPFLCAQKYILVCYFALLAENLEIETMFMYKLASISELFKILLKAEQTLGKLQKFL